MKWREGRATSSTREGRGVQGNGPRRRGYRLSVLSAKPSGAPIDPTRAIPRSQVACGAFTGEFTAIWVLFWRFLAFSFDLTGIVLPMRSEENKMTAKSADLGSQSTNQTPRLRYQIPRPVKIQLAPPSKMRPPTPFLSTSLPSTLRMHPRNGYSFTCTCGTTTSTSSLHARHTPTTLADAVRHHSTAPRHVLFHLFRPRALKCGSSLTSTSPYEISYATGGGGSCWFQMSTQAPPKHQKDKTTSLLVFWSHMGTFRLIRRRMIFIGRV